ncbi:MAG: hypothetical protein EA412_07350 [Chitinophagaceae bacterium]|nr:MAG: hypothetical protein EA412_07350 [Chitinophagaceae bacterium]
MSNLESSKDKILKALNEKACLKKKTYELTKSVFKDFKEVIHTISKELTEDVKKMDTSLEIEYKDKSEYEIELKFAGDTLIFSMHTNVFAFDDSHEIHRSEYVKNNPLNIYCGMIQVYNFLSDSLRYSRLQDVGYMVGRIFINKDKHFFVEGERQLGFLYNDFDNAKINKVYIRAIIETAILYCIDFDLLAQPFKEVREKSVLQKLSESGAQSSKTGKRVGFKFESERQLPS